jgi:tetratricopeptide (TPR) repeat protein
MLGRFGRHALAAGHYRESIEPLYRAAFWSMEGEELERARHFCELLNRALDELEIAETSPERLRAMLLQGWIDERRGEHRQAADLVREVLEQAAEIDELIRDEILGRAYRLRAKLDRRTSLERSTDAAAKAVEHLARAGSNVGELAKAQLAQAWNLGRMGQLDEGIDGIEAAIATFTTHGDPRWLGIAHKSRGYLIAQKGDIDTAVAAIEKARGYAEKVGDRSEIANTYNSLGEFARFREDWATARGHYDNAESMERVTGGLNLPVYRFNRYLVDIGEGNFKRAARGFDALVQDWQELNHAGIVANILMAQVACHAALRDWRAYDRDLSHAERELELSGLIDQDIAWCADIAAKQAQSVGERTRANIAERLAKFQNTALDST